MKTLIGAAGAALMFALALVPQAASAQEAQNAPAATPATGGTLIAVLKADPELSTFAKLAESAGLGTTLSGSGPLTVLAPSNAAFAKLPPAELDELSKPENVAKLQALLLYHVIPAAAPTSALKGTAGELPTANATAKVKVDGTGEVVKVNDATITRADIPASNGTIHVIDTVLTPGTPE